MRNIVCLLLSILLFAALAAPVSAAYAGYGPGFDEADNYSDTATIYYFKEDEAVIVYSKEVDSQYQKRDDVWAGSSLYVPIYSYDSRSTNSTETRVTDKAIKNDGLEISYKALTGERYVESVALVSGKKEKIDDLPAGLYAKVQFTNTFTALDRREVEVRLVITVNGVTYQGTATTFMCLLQNRTETIARNSVYGAKIPMQFNAPAYYSGEATFDFGNNIIYTARVSAGTKYYLHLDKTPNEPLSEMYEDAYMEFYEFKGDDKTFSSTGKLEIPINESKFKQKKTRAELYVYEIQGDTLRSLSADTVAYDSKRKVLTLNTKTLGSYVLSSRALMREVETDIYNIIRDGYASSIDLEEEESAEEI